MATGENGEEKKKGIAMKTKWNQHVYHLRTSFSQKGGEDK